ncbi:hypothetical protein Emin_0456 [Elusimicrobium minutum Pei191]|uniref:Uncharacterized protein n=1 Tax=Elusimicrobium minutum (strain Pei191) TaxID=445932 RepID=B2KBJ1_ELUMP|nr:hypothetical protein [Elusimicrobium minutum]ACC98013.1 hypothetical protein Emin_0456 [Elusimicrobium minutum Pei191]
MAVRKTEEILKRQAEYIMDGRVKLSPKEYVKARNNCFSNGRLRVIQEKCKNRQLYFTSEGGRYFFYFTDVLLNLKDGL